MGFCPFLLFDPTNPTDYGSELGVVPFDALDLVWVNGGPWTLAVDPIASLTGRLNDILNVSTQKVLLACC